MNRSRGEPNENTVRSRRKKSPEGGLKRRIDGKRLSARTGGGGSSEKSFSKDLWGGPCVLAKRGGGCKKTFLKNLKRKLTRFAGGGYLRWRCVCCREGKRGGGEKRVVSRGWDSRLGGGGFVVVKEGTLSMWRKDPNSRGNKVR